MQGAARGERGPEGGTSTAFAVVHATVARREEDGRPSRTELGVSVTDVATRRVSRDETLVAANALSQVLGDEYFGEPEAGGEGSRRGVCCEETVHEVQEPFKVTAIVVANGEERRRDVGGDADSVLDVKALLKHAC